MVDFSTWLGRDTDNVRKALQTAVLVAPDTTAALTKIGLFSATTGVLATLPTGYKDLGWLSDGGTKVTRATKVSEIMADGAGQAIRTDTVSDISTLAVICDETNNTSMAVWHGWALNAFATTPDAGGSLFNPKPELPPTIYYKVIEISMDEDEGGQYLYGRYFPKMAVTARDVQTFQSSAANPIQFGMTLTSYFDSDEATSEVPFIGGAGWLANLAAAGFTAGA